MTEPLSKTEFLLKTFGPFETWSDMDLCMLTPGKLSSYGTEAELLHKELIRAQELLKQDIEASIIFARWGEVDNRRSYLRGKAILAWNAFSNFVCNHK